MLRSTPNRSPSSCICMQHQATRDTCSPVKGELIRYLRNTSDQETWIRKVSWLFKMLKQRGYLNRCLHQALQSMYFKDRAKYMSASTAAKPPMEDAIIVPYNPNARKACRNTRSYMRHVFNDDNIGRRTPTQVIFRRNHTVRGLVGKISDI